MTFKQYLIIMSIATLLCWVAFGFVLFTVDPFYAAATSFVFFYVSLFLSLVGTVSIISCVLLYRFARTPEPMFRYVQKSFRVALLCSIAIVALLVLQLSGYLNFWVGTLYIISLAFAFAFLSVTKKQSGGQSPTFHV